MLAPLTLAQPRTTDLFSRLFDPVRLAPQLPSPLGVAETNPTRQKGDVLQISDLARKLLAAAQKARASESTTFDLHLDLDESSLHMGATGGYDAYARHVNLDLHVSTRSGTMSVDGREVHFEEMQLSMSYSEEQANVQAASGSPRDLKKALGDQLGRLVDMISGRPGDDKDRPSQVAFDGLQSLSDLLGDNFGKAKSLLDGIFRLLLGLARGEQPGDSPQFLGPPDSASGGNTVEGQFDYTREETHLEMHSVSLSYGGAASADNVGKQLDAAA